LIEKLLIALAQAAVVYTVRQAQPAAHRFEVDCRIADPDPQGQVVSLPAWVPGSYMIRDYARHVVSLEAQAGGEAVAVRKLDKSSWRVDPVEGPLVLRAVVYAHDLSVRGAYLDGRHAFVNGVCLFLRVHGRETERCVMHLLPPPGPTPQRWRVATTLTRLSGASWEFGSFEAAGHDHLIDRPLLMGPLTLVEFTVAGVPHALAIAGRHAADVSRLGEDLTLLCEHHIDFFGRPPPMDRYLFLLTVLNEGYGGLEHNDCTALVCCSTDLPVRGRRQMSPGYRKLLGLVSHEYFHLWNVRRIRPAEFSPCDLSRETYTRQLWIFEGITSYYDDLALLRSGLIGADAYLRLLARTLTAVYRTPGRRRQTLEEASFDAWIKFYRQDENAPNAMVSYYHKGAMVALALDLEIRVRSSDRYSLDDVMRAMWAEYGDSAAGMPRGRLEALAEEVTGLDLKTFFDSSLRSTLDPPVGILLAQAGIRLHLRAARSASDRGGEPAAGEDRHRGWLGMRTRADHGRLCVRHVLDDGPAQQAGISAGDELVALNGRRIRPDDFERSLDMLAVGDTVELQLFRRDELLAAHPVIAAAPKEICDLGFDEDAGAQAVERRGRWLHLPPS